jgi:hypothetical protein
MVESDLTLTYWNGLDEVADFQGFGRGHTNEDNLARCREILEAGYRQFLYPPAMNGMHHRWSFMSPLAALVMRTKKESGTTATASVSTVTLTDSTAQFVSYGVEAGDSVTISAGTATHGTYEVASITSETVLVLTLTAGSGTATYFIDEPAIVYPLPDDFGEIIGDMTFQRGQNQAGYVTERNAAFIREKHARGSVAGQPLYYAICPKTFARETGQRWEIVFWPEPDTDYTLEYTYAVYPTKWGYVRATGTGTVASSAKTITAAGQTFMTKGCIAGDKVILSDVYTGQTAGIYVLASTPAAQTVLTLTTAPGADGDCTYEVMPASLYPLGGLAHSESLLASCVAIAEQRRDDMIGPRDAIWQRELVKSVTEDLSMRPKRLGYNGNPSAAAWPRAVRMRGQYVEVNGVIPD